MKEETQQGRGKASPSLAGSARAIPASELVLHKHDIQCQAIEFYKAKDNVFAGCPRKERWKSCIRLVAACWMRLGPQTFASGPTIYLP